MVKKLKMMLKKEKGFTLVELLAVIVILGIILAIAVPSIGNVISESKKDADAANAALFENAAQLAYMSGYKVDESSYTLEELVDENFLEELPINPLGNGEDTYGETETVTHSEGSNFTFPGDTE